MSEQRFLGERTRRNGIVSDSTEWCVRCNVRAFQHKPVLAGAGVYWLCDEAATAIEKNVNRAAEKSLNEQIEKLGKVMDLARGEVVGTGVDGRMTIGDAVKKSKFEKMMGIGRDEALEKKARARAKQEEQRIYNLLSPPPQVPFTIGPVNEPSVEDQFAEYLGTERSTIDELKKNLGDDEFALWFARKEDVKRAMMKARADQERAEERRNLKRQAAAEAQAEMRRQRNAYVSQEIEIRMPNMGGIGVMFAGNSVRKQPPRPQEPVAIGAKRRYFNEE